MTATFSEAEPAEHRTTVRKAGSLHISVFEITSAKGVDTSPYKSTPAGPKGQSENENPGKKKNNTERQHSGEQKSAHQVLTTNKHKAKDLDIINAFSSQQMSHCYFNNSQSLTAGDFSSCSQKCGRQRYCLRGRRPSASTGMPSAMSISR